MNNSPATQKQGPANANFANTTRQSLLVPFVLPQVLFQGGRTTQKMGQGIMAQITFSAPNSDVTFAHNLGHTVLLFWAAMAPAGTFLPKLKISSSSNTAPAEQVILQSDTAGTFTVVMF
jgi:hypothetical protein